MRTAFMATIIALALAAASGCGKKGPLYLPEPEAPSSQSADDTE